MAFIGNTNLTQSFTPAIDTFNGDGSTVAFTLSRPVISVAQIQVVVENVPQSPNSAFSVSGNTLTFTSAPPSGSSNIYVYYVTTNSQVVGVSDGAVGTDQIANGAVTNTKLDVVSLDGTGAAQMPAGTTAQRPSGAVGYFRLNTTTNNPEWYDTVLSTWQPFSYSPYDAVDYLIVAGGGGGSTGYGGIGGGGGGAGGYVAGTFSLVAGTSYTITVGAGGAGAASATSGSVGVAGSNSSVTSLTTAVGGGFSKSWIQGNTASSSGSGGSGGGGTYSTITAGAGTAGQGFAGGSGIASGPSAGGGGGGGASVVGANATSAFGGNGGAGLNWQSLGTFYAGGGGGGGASVGSAGTGGAGGGGNGGSSANGSAATANTGACTLNGKALKVLHDQDPPDNWIEAGSIIHAIYDGTNYQVMTPDANP
jgi:hypothetical protein